MSQYVDVRMQTWIGRTLLDRAGQRIGRVEDIYTDDVSGYPAWLAVATGRFGLNIIFLPFASATPAGGDELRVQFSKSLIRDAPLAGKGGRLTQDEVVLLYDHYGFDLEAEEVRERATNGGRSGPGYRPSFIHEPPGPPPTAHAAQPAAPAVARPTVPVSAPAPAAPGAPPATAPVLRPADRTEARPAARPAAPPRPRTKAPPVEAARPAPPATPLAARFAAPLAARLATLSEVAEPGIRHDSPLLWNHDDRIDSIRPPREQVPTGRR